jgi:hypothetical protein
MGNQKHMKNKKSESGKSSEKKAGPSGVTAANLFVPHRRVPVVTGRTSTPKTMTIHGLRSPEARHMLSITDEEGRAYRDAAVELLWRYKALRAMNRKLLSKTIALESKILDFRTGQRSNVMNLPLNPRRAPTTSETGQSKISPKSWNYRLLILPANLT